MTPVGPPAALVLVDLQRDFLERPGLVPSASQVCAAAADLLARCRDVGVAIAHVHTSTRADGSDRMPHWTAAGHTACVAGTPGAAPPDALRPRSGELVARKQFYSGFDDPGLDGWLREQGVRRLVVAGVYTHGCVRSTVLDAYRRGYEVWVAADAVATPETVHGAASRDWLDGRAARFRPAGEILRDLGAAPATDDTPGVECLPVAMIDGARLPADGHRRARHRDPSHGTTVLTEVPFGGPAEVGAAARAARDAQPAWARRSAADRAEVLEQWAGALADDAPRLADAIVAEVGKPIGAAADEVQRAIGHARTAGALLGGALGRPQVVAPGVAVHRRPRGVVGLVLPWNNPVALPVGKIAPALAFGNAVVLKPAPEGSRTALTFLESLDRAGVPPGLVGVVLGDADTARALCDDPAIDAVSVTGSIPTGRAIAARCAVRAKAVQAELGGNNAAIVLRDADLDQVVPGLMRAAFGFAGQRCTAVRRIVIETAIAARFEELAVAAIGALTVGDPRDPHTEVGPLISASARDRVLDTIARARAEGARLVTGGEIPPGLEHGAWLAPCLLADVDPASAIAQDETFGPVATLLAVADLDEAIDVANGVEQGLVLTVCTSDVGARRRVLDEAQAGIVQVGAGPLPVHPDAPFAGWKASSLGPPEHGAWDAEFYTRPQARYGDGEC